MATLLSGWMASRNTPHPAMTTIRGVWRKSAWVQLLGLTRAPVEPTTLMPSSRDDRLISDHSHR